MRPCGAALLIVAVVAACADEPSLRVDVTHAPDDADIAALVATTTITVYEGALTCREVELGDVFGPALDGFAVTSVTTTAESTSGSFGGVSRLEAKVVVARGQAADGALVTAGCAEHGEIVEDSQLAIATVPTATVSLSAAGDTTRGLVVTTTDPLSRALDGRAVSWRLYGPAGTSADPARYTNVADGVWEPKAPSCTSNGTVTVHPAPPTVPGGYAVQARVAWAAERPPLFTLFTSLDLQVSSALSATALAPCAVKQTATTASVICMESATALAEYKLAGSTLSRTALPAIEDAVAVVSVEDGAARHVYAITNAGRWIAVAGAPAVNPQQLWCNDPLCRTFDLQLVPACGMEASRLVAQVGTIAQSSFVQMPARGGNVTPYFEERAASILNAGCIAEITPSGNVVARQAVALETQTAGGVRVPRVVFTCSAATGRCTNLLAGEGVGFVPGEEPRMVVSDFDATGAVLSTVIARTSANMSTFVQRTRQPAAAPPVQIIPAQLDADDRVDLVWHFAAGPRAASSIQVAYAREVEGAPLTALFPTGATVVELLAADLNGDDFDEAMFVIDTANQGRRLTVIPVGRPYTSTPIPSDAPCTP